jgi:predicted TIM-barrel fold metal-dependent hydrolase
MNVDVLNRSPVAAASNTKLAIADCDIHPVIRSLRESLYPYLSSRWRHHLETYGMSQRVAYQDGAPPYPKGTPNAARRDSWPPGGAPGTDLDFMRAQHLDANNVAFAICNPLMPSGQGFANPQLSAAMCHATNEWQKHALIARESRLRASVVVPYEDTAASVAEIDLRAGDPDFAQVLLLSRTAEPLGQPRYRPIFEAAVRAGLPVAIHAFGYGGSPITSGGWPSYYIEEMAGHAQNSQALLSSLVIEGVFARPARHHRRGRLRVAAGALRPPRQALAADARRDAGPAAPAIRVHPRTGLADHPADGGAGDPRASARHHRLDRLGPAVVRQRLPALGFRRPGNRAATAPDRRAASKVFPRQRQGTLSHGLSRRIGSPDHGRCHTAPLSRHCEDLRRKAGSQ